MARAKMSSLSCMNLRKSIFMFDPARHSESKAEMILDRFLQQYHTVALYRQYNLVKSSSVRPSLSDSVLPASDSANRYTDSDNCHDDHPATSPSCVSSQSDIDLVSNQGSESSESESMDEPEPEAQAEMPESEPSQESAVSSYHNVYTWRPTVYSLTSPEREVADYMYNNRPTFDWCSTSEGWNNSGPCVCVPETEEAHEYIFNSCYNANTKSYTPMPTVYGKYTVEKYQAINRPTSTRYSQGKDMSDPQQISASNSCDDVSASFSRSSVFSTDKVDQDFADYWATIKPTSYWNDSDNSDEEQDFEISAVDSNTQSDVSDRENTSFREADDDFDEAAIDAITHSVLSAVSTGISLDSHIDYTYSQQDKELVGSVGKQKNVTEESGLIHFSSLQDSLETAALHKMSNDSQLASNRKRKCSDDLTSAEGKPSKMVKISEYDTTCRPAFNAKRCKRIAHRQ